MKADVNCLKIFEIVTSLISELKNHKAIKQYELICLIEKMCDCILKIHKILSTGIVIEVNENDDDDLSSLTPADLFIMESRMKELKAERIKRDELVW